MVATGANRTGRLVLVAVVASLLGAGVGLAAKRTSSGASLPAPDFARTLDASAMREAMSKALLEPDTLTRARILDALLDRMTPENVQGAEEAIDAVVLGADDCDIKAYLQTRSRFDPQGAFEQSTAWKGAHKRDLGIYSTAYAWALQGGALQARSFVEDLVDTESARSGMVGLLQGWSRSDDIDGVTRFLMNLPDDPNGTRNDVYLGFLTNPLLAYGGPDHLIAWFDDIPADAPNDFKRAAFRNALLQLASETPLRAVAFLESNEGQPWTAGSLGVLAVAWQKLDPEAAFDWLMQRPPSMERDGAIVRAMRRWHSRDRIAASRWVVQTDLDDQDELRRRLYGLTRQAGRLRAEDGGA